jgi:hypothetical protein
MNKRKSHAPLAIRPGKGFLALFEDLKRETLEKALAAAFQRGDLGDWQKKRQAAVIKRERRREWAAGMRREHAALVDEYRRRGEGSPATRAWNELAAQHGYDSGETLSRSVRRNDPHGQNLLSA